MLVPTFGTAMRSRTRNPIICICNDQHTQQVPSLLQSLADPFEPIDACEGPFLVIELLRSEIHQEGLADFSQASFWVLLHHVRPPKTAIAQRCAQIARQMTLLTQAATDALFVWCRKQGIQVDMARLEVRQQAQVVSNFQPLWRQLWNLAGMTCAWLKPRCARSVLSFPVCGFCGPGAEPPADGGWLQD